MNAIFIGLLREGKNPPDKRVALSPEQCKRLMKQHPHLSIYCQPSHARCFADSEYASAGVYIQEDLSHCDYLMGIKEIPIDQLLATKTYLFFSHTIKQQPHNRDLLKAVLAKKITLIDYECLTNQEGQRLVAFGKFAGIVGAYNAILTYTKRHPIFDLKRAYRCFDINELQKEFSKVKLPPIKIVVTGSGKVAGGVKMVLDGMCIHQVSPSDFLEKNYSYPVYTLLRSADYHESIDGSVFSSNVFHHYPDRFKSTFLRYAQTADILIAAAYWNPKAPLLFTKEDMKKTDFTIKIIADITCDINGSIPSTQRVSRIDDPWYDYNPITEKIEDAFSKESNISVMAIDNLPCELPRDSSISFGEQLIESVIPDMLLDKKPSSTLLRATIATEGKLTKLFSYLEDFVK